LTDAIVVAMSANDGRREVRFEGLTADEILALPQDEIGALVLTGRPLVFRIGTATILGEFKTHGNRLVIELAQIEEGGEGVLVALGALSRRYATLNGLAAVEWIVHAVTCAKPNLKLRRVLQRRGFAIRQLEGIGEAYHYVDVVPSQME
jgi:hypothetical protein